MNRLANMEKLKDVKPITVLDQLWLYNKTPKSFYEFGYKYGWEGKKLTEAFKAAKDEGIYSQDTAGMLSSSIEVEQGFADATGDKQRIVDENQMLFKVYTRWEKQEPRGSILQYSNQLKLKEICWKV